MPSPFKLGNLRFTVPNSWDECSTKLFFELSATDPNDYLAMLSVLSGVDKRKLSNIKQFNLDQILEPHLNWMGDKIDWKNIYRQREVILGLKKIKVPDDLDLESFGQKIVMDGIIKECTKTDNEVTTVNFSRLIPYAFAVYFCGKYYGKDFERDLVDNMIPKVMDMPIMTVYPIGAFFLRTHFGFGSSTTFDLILTQTTMRWLQRFKSWINSVRLKLSTRSLGGTS